MWDRDWTQIQGGTVAGWWRTGPKALAVAAPAPLGLCLRAWEPACIWGDKGKMRLEARLNLTCN